ncbi:MAG: hypothetical protein GX109_02820 [Bacteroidales bacterium]|nr:hypothetical protein [Bacteroidales bacterium]
MPYRFYHPPFETAGKTMNAPYVQLIQQSLSDTVYVDLPTSKSISNRLLMLKETYHTTLKIKNLSKADDTLLLEKLLLDIQTHSTEDDPVKRIHTQNSGTCFRFLCAYLCVKKGKWLLTGDTRMKSRPIEALVTAMQACGAKITYKEKHGFPPLEITGQECLCPPQNIEINAEKSSQFVSAILLILPLLKKDIVVKISHLKASKSYIEMTIGLMQKLGIDVSMQENIITYKHTDSPAEIQSIEVEYDWSSAAYWFAWVALQYSTKVCIKKLRKSSLQSDAVIEKIMYPFGLSLRYTREGLWIEKKFDKVPPSFTYDCSNHIDLVPVLAVLCAALEVKATLKGIHHLSYKESDRLQALYQELNKITTVKYTKNTLKITPVSKSLSSAPCFASYQDHRIAMSLSLFIHKYQTIYIENPACVSKSYPDFWENLRKTGIEIRS